MKEIKLQTSIKTTESAQLFEYGIGICGIGSCFAQDILNKMYDLGFCGSQNPNGIVYNSNSMAVAISRCVNNQQYSENDFFEFNSKWCSWDHHGFFSDPILEKAIDKANNSLMLFQKNIKECSLFILTPSSSVVYELIESNRIVSNCHKVPNNKFNRRLLSVKENEDSLVSLVENIRVLNSECKVIMTLSYTRI